MVMLRALYAADWNQVQPELRDTFADLANEIVVCNHTPNALLQ
jgi:hypothetical protein